jgi:hypothetical protein
MGMYATQQAGRRQGEVAADRRAKKRQESIVAVVANLAVGPTISLALAQPLRLRRQEKRGWR